MRFLVAPNAFKGTIDADRAAQIIKTALLEHKSVAEVQLCPIADGGDGTCDLLGKQLQLKKHAAYALDAIGRPTLGHFFLNFSQATAYLDVSTVSGVKHLKTFERDAWLTSTFGTGELIQHAITSGAKHVVLGLGGSATVDMGAGILRALGFLFLDSNGREIPHFSPGFLAKVAHIQRPLQLPKISFTCLCDVKNTFFGAQGAIPVFGPQKGLKQEDHLAYEAAAQRVFELFRRKSPIDLADKSGFGAAGGIALGLSAFFPVDVVEGAAYFFEQVGMEEKIRGADYIVTGEGRFDFQSAGGKGSYELLQLAKKHGKKSILITSGEEGGKSGFDYIMQLPDLKGDSPQLKLEAERNLFSAVAAFSAMQL